MICGTLVITSNKSSLSEVIGRDGIAVTPSEPSEIIQALERSITEDGLERAFNSQRDGSGFGHNVGENS